MQVSLCLLLMNMNERIANVFVDFESAKHGKIDSRIIYRATHMNKKRMRRANNY